jgi:hypothetical protein
MITEFRCKKYKLFCNIFTTRLFCYTFYIFVYAASVLLWAIKACFQFIFSLI